MESSRVYRGTTVTRMVSTSLERVMPEPPVVFRLVGIATV